MTPSEVRFAADGMLQSLGTWLRLLGYDCAGGAGSFGRALVEQSLAEDRVFLTRNVHLPLVLPRVLTERARIDYVAAEHLPGQLREVVGRFSLDPQHFTFSRCVECNKPLDRVQKSDAVGLVPPDVAERDEEFWRCSSCQKTFWRGSHVENSIERLRNWLALPVSET